MEVRGLRMLRLNQKQVDILYNHLFHTVESFCEEDISKDVVKTELFNIYQKLIDMNYTK